MNKVRSGDFERDGGGVALSFDDLAVTAVVRGRVVMSSVKVDFYAVVFPGVGGVVLEDRVQDFDGHIKVVIVPEGGEGGGVVVGSGDCSGDGFGQRPDRFVEIAIYGKGREGFLGGGGEGGQGNGRGGR